MKKWISPPIQWLFWLLGLAFLAYVAWNIWELINLSEDTGRQSSVTVDIPDMSALDAPSIMSYRYIVESPLFWASRSAPQNRVTQARAVPVQAPPVVVIDKNLPPGRLVGIIDLGTKSYAIMSDDDTSHYLYEGDKWGNWTVSGIDPDKVILVLDEERQELPLVADFSSPQENPKLVAARQTQQRQQAQKKNLQKLQKQMAQQTEAGSSADDKDPIPNAAFPDEVKEMPPILSIKDALEARKRLMESRWGALGSRNSKADKSE